MSAGRFFCTRPGPPRTSACLRPAAGRPRPADVISAANCPQSARKMPAARTPFLCPKMPAPRFLGPPMLAPHFLAAQAILSTSESHTIYLMLARPFYRPHFYNLSARGHRKNSPAACPRGHKKKISARMPARASAGEKFVVARTARGYPRACPPRRQL